MRLHFKYRTASILFVSAHFHCPRKRLEYILLVFECRISVVFVCPLEARDGKGADSLSLESCSESGLTGVGSLHERLKLLALRSA